MSTLFPSSWDEFFNSLIFTGKRPLYDPQGRYIGYSSPGRDVDLCRGVAQIAPQGYAVPASQWHIKSGNWIAEAIGAIEPVSNHCIREGFTPTWGTRAGSSVNVPDPRGGSASVMLRDPGIYPLSRSAEDAGTSPTGGSFLDTADDASKLLVPLAIGGGLLAAILLLRR